MATPVKVSKASAVQIDAAALIVYLALERGVDPYAWFLEDEEGSSGNNEVVLLRTTEFASRLSSLAFGVTVGESSKVMLEVERGLSEAALAAILASCGDVGKDEIDVALFLELCNTRIEGGFLAKKGAVPSPLPSPKGGGGGGGAGGGFFFGTSDKVYEAVLPSSPYDEEVIFDLEYGDDDLGATKARGLLRLEPSSRKQLAARASANSGANIGKKAAVGTTFRVVTSSSDRRTKASTDPATLARPRSAPPAGDTRQPPIKGQPENPVLQADRDVVEDRLRRVARSPDLYHQLQVHLGWQEPLALPPRGPLVQPAPKDDDQWLPLDVVAAALLEAKERFGRQQLETLVALVSDHAKERRQQLVSDSISPSCITASEDGPVARRREAERQRRANRVLCKGRLSARWFRLFLEHLRLHKRLSSAVSALQTLPPDAPLPLTAATVSSASAAVTTSASSSSSSAAAATTTVGGGGGVGASLGRVDGMPRELLRALAGRPHGLGQEELLALLRRHPILSEAQVAHEVRHRVHCWRSDKAGTRDFSRAMRLASSQWARTSGRGGCLSRLPEHRRAEVEAELEAQVLRVRQEEMFSAERVEGAITRELFRRFDAFCRGSNYSRSCSWLEWIEWWTGEREMKARELDVRRVKRVAAARLSASLEKLSNQPPPSPFAFTTSAGPALPSPLSSKARALSLSQRAAAININGKTDGPGSSSPPPSPSPSSPSASSRPQSQSLGQRHGALLRSNLAASRSSIMAAGLGGSRHALTFSSGISVLAPLDVGLPPDSPRPNKAGATGAAFQPAPSSSSSSFSSHAAPAAPAAPAQNKLGGRGGTGTGVGSAAFDEERDRARDQAEAQREARLKRWRAVKEAKLRHAAEKAVRFPFLFPPLSLRSFFSVTNPNPNPNPHPTNSLPPSSLP